MPQASEDLRKVMAAWFPAFPIVNQFGNPDWETNESGTWDWPVIAFLQSRGYKLTKKYTWLLPTPSHTISREEWMCIHFLIEEWDFGHIDRDIHPHFYRVGIGR